METINNLRKALWIGSDYDKGLNGKKILIYGYHVPKYIEDSSTNNPTYDTYFKKFAERIRNFFNFNSTDELINRITYVNLCNADKIIKSEIIDLITDLKPDIVILCGVNLRDDIFNPYLIIEDTDLAEILICIENSKSLSNVEQKYIYKKEIKGRPYIVLNTFSLAYDFGDGNNIFDENKLSLFMSICLDNNIYDKIIKNEPVKIKAEGTGDDELFNLTFLSE